VILRVCATTHCGCASEPYLRLGHPGKRANTSACMPMRMTWQIASSGLFRLHNSRVGGRTVDSLRSAPLHNQFSGRPPMCARAADRAPCRCGCPQLGSWLSLTRAILGGPRETIGRLSPMRPHTYSQRSKPTNVRFCRESSVRPSKGQDHYGRAGIMRGDEHVTFQPLPGDRHLAARYPLPDLRPQPCLPAR
jgi:hypothetical protein